MMNLQGSIIKNTDKNFDEAVMATLFNKRIIERRPEMMISPKTIDDIKEVIRYAKVHGKKVSICSGGHSWSANHIRNGSILINMENFNQYEVDKNRMIAKAGPACGGSTLLTTLMKNDLFFPAGHCKGVCIGGYLLQGGFAWNGRKLGMACESVIGLDIVTAEGEYLYADAEQNSDLYWAARGSGAGFFGIVTCFHLKLYPKPKYCGTMSHIFSMKYLEDVYQWAYEVGPSVPSSVEFQLLMTKRTLKYLAPGIEALAPIFAESKEELDQAREFMEKSPIKRKAFLRTPYIETNIALMYNFAMTHYPDDYCWGVDNMWTHASINDLMPYLKEIAETLPPAPAHFLWLNWQPPVRQTSMAFSMEDKIYLALYGAWESNADTPKYGNLATDMMRKMSHLATGIQLADENLNHRTTRFISDDHLAKLTQIRSDRDPKSTFNEWHSKPSI